MIAQRGQVQQDVSSYARGNGHPCISMHAHPSFTVRRHSKRRADRLMNAGMSDRRRVIRGGRAHVCESDSLVHCVREWPTAHLCRFAEFSF
jgi:hypothetical protein